MVFFDKNVKIIKKDDEKLLLITDEVTKKYLITDSGKNNILYSSKSEERINNFIQTQ